MEVVEKIKRKLVESWADVEAEHDTKVGDELMRVWAEYVGQNLFGWLREIAAEMEAEDLTNEKMFGPLAAVISELYDATRKNASFNSAHEGYAVILEELDELWEEVRKKRSERSIERMRHEAIQVAAMGIRFIIDCCGENGEGG